MWIEKLEDGRFKYIERYKDPYTEKTRRVSTVLTSDSLQAKKKAGKILEEKLSLKILKSSQKNMTFEELFEKWKPIYYQNVKNQTYRNAISAYKVVTNWFDENTIVRNVDSTYIQGLLDDFYYNKNYSYSYTDLLRNFLSNVFEYGKSIGAVDKNVIKETTLKKKIQEKDQLRKKTVKFLEADELALVLERVRSWKAPIKPQRRKRYADILELMSLTGLRFGEAAALKNDDIDGNKLTVDETLYYNYGDLKKGTTETPKNQFSERTILLSNRAFEIVHEWQLENKINKSLNPDYKDMEFLFTDENGIPIGIAPVNHILRNIRVQLKNEGKLDKELTTHIFRHTHISQLVEMGLPLKTIMARVGHVNPNTTLKIYTHVTDQMDKQLLEKLNEREQKENHS